MVHIGVERQDQNLLNQVLRCAEQSVRLLGVIQRQTLYWWKVCETIDGALKRPGGTTWESFGIELFSEVESLDTLSHKKRESAMNLADHIGQWSNVPPKISKACKRFEKLKAEYQQLCKERNRQTKELPIFQSLKTSTGDEKHKG